MGMEILFFTVFAGAILTGLVFPDSKMKIWISNGLLGIAFVLLGYFALEEIAITTTYTYSVALFGGMNIFRIGLVEAYFLVLLSALGIGVALYSIYYFGEYLHHGKHLRFSMTTFFIFLLSLVLVITANEAVTFLVFWEIMSFSSYLLVVGNYREDGALLSGAYYLIITHIGMFFIFLSFLPFVQATGSSTFSDWSSVGAHLDTITANLVFFSALVWFGAKAGLVPLHVWLPRAHAIAPSNVSAVMSAFMIKIPVLFLFRYVFVFFGGNIPLSWGVVVLVLALGSSFFGVFYALISSNFKKLLAYSSIENIGIIFIGFGIAMIGLSLHNALLLGLGFLGAFYHLINHAFFKTLLFLVAGSLIERTGTGRFDRLGGIAKTLPTLAKFLLVGILAIAALPPLNGFLSEFITYVALIEGARLPSDNLALLFFGGGIILAITSVFAFITFTNFYGIACLGEPREERIIQTKRNIFETLAFMYFSIGIIALALVPWFVIDAANRLLVAFCVDAVPVVTSSDVFSFTITNMATYDTLRIFVLLVVTIAGVLLISRVFFRRVRIVPSWNCGYQYAVPRAQYTAFSIIQPLRRVFSYLYLESKTQKRREKGGLYAKHGMDFEYTVHDHFILERFLYDPIILFAARMNHQVRRIQNGDLQAYLLYMFVSIIALLSIYFLLF